VVTDTSCIAIERAGWLAVQVFSPTPRHRGRGRSGLVWTPLSQIFGGKFLSSLWACCLDRQFVRPRLIELAGSDVILPDIVVPQAVRVPPESKGDLFDAQHAREYCDTHGASNI
jgi:hypothetical protein